MQPIVYTAIHSLLNYQSSRNDGQPLFCQDINRKTSHPRKLTLRTRSKLNRAQPAAILKKVDFLLGKYDAVRLEKGKYLHKKFVFCNDRQLTLNKGCKVV
ncbi:hypothetical protein KR51_00016620 [Rubidibacter lacunae KORDI 51-2]|uniref:Uncharacterized protein n=1 Tax=Rubidibacter lacunae KORDI 51-2 TaxID=582515 RepID=U5DMI0_9CHRO|nr:hypothetical protein KR51_00016620 [Rubidibacter lacunae KORDI 51-2]